MAPVRRTTSPSWISLENIYNVKMVVINANVYLPIIAENDDSDIVGFEVQRHSSDSTGEFDHFSGLNFL
jgi:hypothetical protein